MPSDEPAVSPSAATAIDRGLLNPVTVGHDAMVSDGSVVDALVTVEVALQRAVALVSDVPLRDVDARSKQWGWRGRGELVEDHGIDSAIVAREAVEGGNPVIPIVAHLRRREAADAGDIHRGATSQDVLDSATMLTAARVRGALLSGLDDLDRHLVGLSRAHRDRIAAARTLTQHAVPTTVGLRAASWLLGVRRARVRLQSTTLPVQLGGAGGTLSAFVAALGEDAAARLPDVLAVELALDAADAPWHTTRWPITELGDALVQIVDALGRIATDVATLARTEIAEVSEARGGASSTMPQKRNPVGSVLVRSAALRAPQLGASLHSAAAFAGDERPDGPWHAEWPALRELERLALGAVAHSAAIIADLVIHPEAVDRNLRRTGGLIVSEHLVFSDSGLTAATVRALVARAAADGSPGALETLLADALVDARSAASASALLDPRAATGLASRLVDRITAAGSGT